MLKKDGHDCWKVPVATRDEARHFLENSLKLPDGCHIREGGTMREPLLSLHHKLCRVHPWIVAKPKAVKESASALSENKVSRTTYEVSFDFGHTS
eukprot:6308175-Amphidinium_carterae.1